MGDGILAWLLWLLLFTGAATLYVGRRGRRVGTEPRCAKCEYILTGSDGPQCPECGTERRPANTVYGEHRRRPRLLILGIALLLASAPLAVRMQVGQAGWYAHMPTWWVIHELGHNPDARREITARIAAGQLSDGQWRQLVERALDEQLASEPDGAILELLGTAAQAGKISTEQYRRLLDHGTDLVVRTRERVGEGRPLHAEVMVKSRIPISRWLYAICTLNKAERDREDQHITRRELPGSGLGVTAISPFQVTAGAHGRHVLRVSGRVDLLSIGQPGGTNADTVVASKRLSAETAYEVVAPEQAPRIRTIGGPERDEQFQRAMGVKQLRYTKQHRLEGRLEAGVPFPIAVRIALKGPDGKELVAGGAAVKAWPVSSSSLFLPISASWPGEPPEKVSVIVRSSAEAAAECIDMDEVYVGEVELKDVPVEVE